MNVSIGLMEGIREIQAHKFRSFLTMAGIILGVASLMSMFALTAGAIAGSRQALEQVGGLETIEIVDAPIPAYQEAISELSPGRTYVDALALRDGAPFLSHISPEEEIGGGKIVHGGRQMRPRIIGVQPDYLEIVHHTIEQGRFINQMDLDLANRICVIGRTVLDELWEEPVSSPLGEYVLINEIPFQIVGVFEFCMTADQKRRQELGISKQQEERRRERLGRSRVRREDPFWWKNRMVVIPLTTMQSVFKSSRMENGVEQGSDPKLTRLTVKVKSLELFNAAVQQIRNVLLQTHRGIHDFGFNTQEDWFDSIETQNRAMKLTGGVIAGISLLVGGLGIANTMLASISERVREIGIRRAVGARAGDLFIQIVIESTLLAMVGGVLGVLAGWGLSQALIWVAPSANNPIIEWDSVLFSFSFSLGVGVLAGLYPAWKAARLSPIQALRYE